MRSFGFGGALLIFFLLGLSTLAWSAGKSLRYEVEGEASWVGRDGKYVEGGGRTSSFFIAVDDAQWYIKLIPSNWPVRIRFDKKVPELLSCEMSSDGRNTYEVRQYNPADFSNPDVNQWSSGFRDVNQWSSGFLLGRGSIREMYPVWYAYASHLYLRGVTNGSLIALEPGVHLTLGSFQTNSSPPGLPQFITATNLESTSKSEFRVLSYTNIGNLSLPLEATCSYTGFGISPLPWSTVRIVLHKCRLGTDRTSFVLKVNDGPRRN